jgi:hypothetical protein
LLIKNNKKIQILKHLPGQERMVTNPHMQLSL